MFLISLFGLGFNAHAVPQRLTQQGRLLDSGGAAVVGYHDMTFRLYDDHQFGSLLWEDTLSVSFDNGYYAAVLGADVQNNPIADSVLNVSPLYLEMEVDNQGPLTPREQLFAAPYARVANVSVSLEGGSANATEVMINGSLVIDGSGSWVGTAMTPNWLDIQSVPGDLLDGDDDTLSGISCSLGELLGWNGSQWACVSDGSLTEAEVEQFIVNDPIDLATGSMVGGDPIVTASTDMVLSDSDVDAYVENDPLNLSMGSMVDGREIMTAANCLDGELVSYSAATNTWQCINMTALFDYDGDGVSAWEDCDDANSAVGSNSNDADCDGLDASLDCADYDPSNTTSVLDDGDCDGLLTADDCDDSNPNSTAIANDGDCDGAETWNDCDDNDPNSNWVADDADCDGFVTSLDCDDNNALIYPGAPETMSDGIDQDCDGFDSTPAYSGTIEMPANGIVSGWSSYWDCSSNMRTTTRITLTENCEQPTISIHQHSSSDTSIYGSYYITDDTGNVLDDSPFDYHSGCSDCFLTPTNMANVTLQANTFYHLGFQNDSSVCDMSGPSVYTDSNARTVGIATFDDPRMDQPGHLNRGLPSSTSSWQNRWQVICQ